MLRFLILLNIGVLACMVTWLVIDTRELSILTSTLLAGSLVGLMYIDSNHARRRKIKKD